MDDFEIEDWYSHVNKIQNDNLISIYPNPSIGTIHIAGLLQHTGIQEISIYDINGVEVYTATAKPILQLDLPNGIYLLKYSTEDSYAIKRIVINK